MTPSALMEALKSGLPTFPMTPFKPDLSLDRDGYAAHIAWLAGHGPSLFFSGGVNGEFFSLDLDEVPELVRIAKANGGGRPVVAGVGYGTRIAIQLAQASEAAGADGILLLPPYLVAAEPDGLVAHIKAVAQSVGVGLIVYNRDNCVLGAEALQRLCDTCPNIIAVKDGHGDLKLAGEIIGALKGRAAYLCGMPTAEIAARAYRDAGADNYTSGVFNFAPRMALDFHRAVRARDEATVDRLVAGFFDPFVKIRDRHKGSLIPMVKGGVRAAGRDPGVVRPPLVDLRPQDQSDLAALVAQVTAA